MKVKATRNLIYDATFYKTGSEIDMRDDEVARYESRVSRSDVPKPAPIVNELPPLNDIVRKKK